MIVPANEWFPETWVPFFSDYYDGPFMEVI